MPYGISLILMLLLALFVVLYLTGHKYKVKYDKAIDLLRFLVKYRRISPEEYKAAIGVFPPPDTTSQSPDNPTETPIAEAALVPDAGLTERSAIPNEALAGPSSEASTTESQSNKQPEKPDNRETSPTDRSVFSLNIMLVTGVLFVVLAGTIFATTTWLYLPDIIRMIIICSVSLLFFAASSVAQRLLKIRKTAVALYSIGAFFLPIAVLSVGYFALIGHYFSLAGEGRFWLFSVASLLLCVASLVGSVKYLSRYFTEFFLYCITVTVICVLEAFALPTTIIILLLYAYAALLIGIAYKAQSLATVSSRFSHIAKSIPLFSLTNSIVIAAAGCILSDGGTAMALGTVILSFLFLTDLFRGRKYNPGVYYFSIVLTAGIFMLITDGAFIHYLLAALVSIILVTSTGCMSIFPANMQKVFVRVSTIMACILYLAQYVQMIISDGFTWRQILVISGILVVLVFIGYHERRRLFLAMASIPAVTLLWGLVSLGFPKLLSYGCTVALLLAVLFVILGYLDRKLALSPRTVMSDVVVAISLCLCVLVDWVRAFSTTGSNPPRPAPLYGSIVALLLLAAALCFFIFEKKKNKVSAVMGVILPVALLVIYIPVHFLLPADRASGYILVAFYFALCVMGIGLILLGNHNKKASLVEISFLIILCLTAPLFCALRIFGEAKPYPLFPLFLCIYLAVRLQMQAKIEKETRNKTAHIAGSFGFGFAAYCFAYIASYDWFSVRESFVSFLIVSIVATFFCLTGIILSRSGNLPRGLSHLSRIGAYGLTLLSFLLTLTFQANDSLYLIIMGALILCLAAAAEYQFGYDNLTAWIQPLCLAVMTFQYFVNPENAHENARLIYALSILVILFLLAGRILHRRVFSMITGQGKNKYSIDFISTSAVIPLLILTYYCQFEAKMSMAYLLMALYIFSFRGRIGGQKTKQYVTTAAVAFLFLAIWLQPIITIPGPLFAYWSALLFVGYFLVLRYVVWKTNIKTMDILVYLSVCITFFALGIRALLSGKLSDALVIGILSFVMMSLSFICKRKKWFFLSSLTILLLAIYMTRSFWTSIAWWVYLLAVGILLIGLAAANEIMKQRGISLKDSTKRIFHTWK